MGARPLKILRGAPPLYNFLFFISRNISIRVSRILNSPPLLRTTTGMAGAPNSPNNERSLTHLIVAINVLRSYNSQPDPDLIEIIQAGRDVRTQQEDANNEGARYGVKIILLPNSFS